LRPPPVEFGVLGALFGGLVEKQLAFGSRAAPRATGAAISCGTGTAYRALRRLKISGDDTIALFGQGPVGLSATQLASAMGARVIALDVSPERLARAKEFGAWETVNPRSNDPVGAIKDLTHGGADFTLDTSSQPEGRIAAVRSARCGARCALLASATM
jgi:D-arabinose 1-dehydrogenase-like Zn-dependent alcohol dehydrogenase